VIPDAPPSVYFEKPGRNKDCSAAMRETLWVEAIDDIGIRSMSVATQKNSEPAVPYIQRFIRSRTGMVKLARLELPLALSGFSLYPGDTLRYWATRATTGSFMVLNALRRTLFLSRAELRGNSRTGIAGTGLHRACAAIGATEEQRPSAVGCQPRAIGAGEKSLSWEQQQIVRDLKQEMAAQADSLSKAVQSFREAVDKLKQEQSVPSDLLSKMNEVQKAIEELRQQYGDSLLFSMPKGNESVSMRDLQHRWRNSRHASGPASGLKQRSSSSRRSNATRRLPGLPQTPSASPGSSRMRRRCRATPANAFPNRKT